MCVHKYLKVLNCAWTTWDRFNTALFFCLPNISLLQYCNCVDYPSYWFLNYLTQVIFFMFKFEQYINGWKILFWGGVSFGVLGTVMLLMITLLFKLPCTSTVADVSETHSMPFQINEYTNTWPSNIEGETDIKLLKNWKDLLFIPAGKWF